MNGFVSTVRQDTWSIQCVEKRRRVLLCCWHRRDDRRVPLINSFNNDILINFKFVHTNKMTQIFWIITSVNYEDWTYVHCLLVGFITALSGVCVCEKNAIMTVEWRRNGCHESETINSVENWYCNKNCSLQSDPQVRDTGNSTKCWSNNTRFYFFCTSVLIHHLIKLKVLFIENFINDPNSNPQNIIWKDLYKEKVYIFTESIIQRILLIQT